MINNKLKSNFHNYYFYTSKICFKSKFHRTNLHAITYDLFHFKIYSF